MSVRQKSLDSHHLHSSLREKIVEHVFVGEALRTLWQRGVFGQLPKHGPPDILPENDKEQG